MAHHLHAWNVIVFLADLQKLALFGRISEQVMACTFVTGLLNHLKHTLWTSLRMDKRNVSQLLARTSNE